MGNRALNTGEIDRVLCPERGSAAERESAHTHTRTRASERDIGKERERVCVREREIESVCEYV